MSAEPVTGYEQAPLFDVGPGQRQPTRKRASTPAAGRGRCPDHPDVSALGTPFYRQGQHHVWGVHWRAVGSKGKTAAMCPASGAALCTAPSEDGATCPCGGTS